MPNPDAWAFDGSGTAVNTAREEEEEGEEDSGDGDSDGANGRGGSQYSVTNRISSKGDAMCDVGRLTARGEGGCVEGGGHVSPMDVDSGASGCVGGLFRQDSNVSEGVGRDGPGEGPRPVDDSSEGDGGMGGGVRMEEDVPPGLVDVEMHLGVGGHAGSSNGSSELSGVMGEGAPGSCLARTASPSAVGKQMLMRKAKLRKKDTTTPPQPTSRPRPRPRRKPKLALGRKLHPQPEPLNFIERNYFEEIELGGISRLVDMVDLTQDMVGHSMLKDIAY
jgi:hypothetical protein